MSRRPMPDRQAGWQEHGAAVCLQYFRPKVTCGLAQPSPRDGCILRPSTGPCTLKVDLCQPLPKARLGYQGLLTAMHIKLAQANSLSLSMHTSFAWVSEDAQQLAACTPTLHTLASIHAGSFNDFAQAFRHLSPALSTLPKFN